MIEVKINKEIRDYTEGVYFGLNLRQLFFSVIAIGVAVTVYFMLRERFAIGTLSWICILCAAPFAAIGFIKYHGMSCEKFILSFIRTAILMPGELALKPANLYYAMLKDTIQKREKEQMNVDV